MIVHKFGAQQSTERSW